MGLIGGRPMPHARRAPLVGAVATLLVVVGCSGPPADRSPSRVATTSAVASAPSFVPEVSVSQAPGTGWTRVATFSADEASVVPIGLAASAGMFVAIGRDLGANEGGPVVVGQRMWRSVDGESWTPVALPDQIGEGSLVAIITARDGRFVLFTSVPADPGEARIVAFASRDGQAWTPVADTGLPDRLYIAKVTGDARGYALLGSSPIGADLGIWLSDDGLRWRSAYATPESADYIGLWDVGVGDEGVVVMADRTRRAETSIWHRMTIASSDGDAWFEGPEPFGVEPPDFRPQAAVSPLGPDWVAAGRTRDGRLVVVHSADGLHWAPSATLAGVADTVNWSPVLVEFDGLVWFGQSNPNAPVDADGRGIWTSGDGATWTQVPIPPGITLGGVAGDVGQRVLVGATPQPDGWADATFWRFVSLAPG